MNDKCGCNDYNNNSIFIFTRKLRNYTINTDGFTKPSEAILLDELNDCNNSCLPICGIIRNIQLVTQTATTDTQNIGLRILSSIEPVFDVPQDYERVIFENSNYTVLNTYDNFNIFIPFMLKSCKKMYVNFKTETETTTADLFIKISGVIT